MLFCLFWREKTCIFQITYLKIKNDKNEWNFSSHLLQIIFYARIIFKEQFVDQHFPRHFFWMSDKILISNKSKGWWKMKVKLKITRNYSEKYAVFFQNIDRIKCKITSWNFSSKWPKGVSFSDCLEFVAWFFVSLCVYI